MSARATKRAGTAKRSNGQSVKKPAGQKAATGRPKNGEPSAKVVGARVQCPKCGSTERTNYNGTKEREIHGTLRDGTSYTHIVWKRCRCKQCGQSRVEIFHENRKKKGK